MMYDHNKQIINHASRYVTTIMQFADSKIPKSTTCCWRLSKYYKDWCMYQYFVTPRHMFGIDISSNVLCHNNDVGSTFMSSLFHHCTTIPIWKRKEEDIIYFEGPKDMYNFAWGSNGKAREK